MKLQGTASYLAGIPSKEKPGITPDSNYKSLGFNNDGRADGQLTHSHRKATHVESSLL
jgi:hypothetical protein